ncbi:MAG: hypothetical protein IPM24_03880 [Bryobacterales bacterium]|nr:hypothetical protein [Bryobacterales bacterium]
MTPTFPRRPAFDTIQRREGCWRRPPACYISRTPRRCWRCHLLTDRPHLSPGGGLFACPACCAYCAVVGVTVADPGRGHVVERERKHPPRAKPIW